MTASNRAIFVDTSAWIALLNKDDRYHKQALDVLRDLAAHKNPLVTMEWVFAETGNGLARTRSRRHVTTLMRSFRESSSSQLVSVDEALFTQALDLYDQSRGKPWGLVDCLSFVVMNNQQITDVLTVDSHFRQAGFRCLLLD